MKVLLADDHILFREGVKHLFARLDLRVQTVETGSGTEVIRLAQSQPDFDLVLLDLGLPDVDGFAGLTALREHAPSVPVVVLSGSEDPADIQAALNAGAAGYIPKSASPAVILGALQVVLAGGVYIPSRALERPTVGSQAHLALLTPRQRDVLTLLAQGKSNKQIGETLGLTEATVKQHVSAILKTLGVTNRTQAVLAGRRLSRD